MYCIGSDLEVQLLELEPEERGSPAAEALAPITVHEETRLRWAVATGCWLLVLVVAWGVTRLTCTVASLPYDCHELVLANSMLNLSDLLEKGLVIAALTRLPYSIHQRLSRRALVGWTLVTVGSGPVFSALGQLHFLHQSLSTDTIQWNAATGCYLGVGVLLLLVVGAHSIRVWQLPLTDRHLYVVSRLGLALFYIAFLTTIGAHLHFHHYFIGLWVALLGYDEHWLSLGLITVGSGIMAQGLGAYGVATLTDR